MPTITDLIGRVLQTRYRLEAGLGTGASAHVFLAYDSELERHVAVKLLHPGLANDETFLRRFRAEARAAAMLNHPNIVQIYDWGEDQGEPFLVLEYLSGGSLRNLIDRGTELGPAEVVQIGAQTARGLEYAHKQGLVHRDIKPANLLFDDAGTVHIADFGLARALADATWTEPVGVVFGTARYASPEQAIGTRVGDRSDVYSLALVCYEALVGEAPFKADTPFATLMARIDSPLPPSPRLGPLGPILAAATLNEPLDRLDAGTFAAKLEALLKTLPPARIRVEHAAVGAFDSGNAAFLHAARDSDETAVIRIAKTDDTDVIGIRGPVTEQVPIAEEDTTSAPRPRKRLFRRAMLALFVVLALAAGALAYVRFAVFGDSVPKLVGAASASAIQRVRSAGLHVGTQTHRYSTSVPSGQVLSQSPQPGTHVRSGTPVDLVFSSGHAPVAVPHLVGMTSSAASQLLRTEHFVASIRQIYSETAAIGTVVKSTPAVGKALYGSKISMQVSRGPRPRTVPNLSGLPYATAKADITGLRLVPRETRSYSDNVAVGMVISSTPAAGTPGIPVGTTVDVVVSRGPQMVAVPAVAGEPIASAVTALQAAGLVVSEQVGPPFATTASTTDPAAGTELLPGSNVTLYVS